MDTQRLLVLSDTHGNTPALKKVLLWAEQQNTAQQQGAAAITAAAFLGDGASDLRQAADAAGFFCDWKMVRGNNDHETFLQDAAVFDFCGHRFFMCHGHRYSLYNGTYALVNAARASQADAALFGHTHVPYHKQERDVLLVNPGSVSLPRSRVGATFAVIECTPDKPLSVQFWSIGAKITEITIVR
jgi:putative phosphoesterase